MSVDGDENNGWTLLLDAITVFCMGLFPNLETLLIGVHYFFEEDAILPSLCQKIQRRKPGKQLHGQSLTVAEAPGFDYFANLTELRVCHTDTEMATSASEFENLLIMSSLREFYGLMINWNTTLTHRHNQYFYTVVLENSLIEAPGFRNLLELCPTLRVLKISWGDTSVVESELDLHSFGDSLRAFGLKLQELSMDYREPGEDFGYGDNERLIGRLGNLSSIQQLARLSVHTDMLLGKEVFDYGAADLDEDEEGKPELPLQLEPCLPKSLKPLRLYRVYEKEEVMQQQMVGVLTSPRLTNLVQLRVWGIEGLKQRLDNFGWVVGVESEPYRKDDLVFVRTLPMTAASI